MTLDDLLARLVPLQPRHGNSPVIIFSAGIEAELDSIDQSTLNRAEVWLFAGPPIPEEKT